MRTTLEETLEKTGIMVIDGSMSTALEHLGCELSDDLWTAKVLSGQPECIEQVHYDYFCAGADCGITASYQATIPGFVKKGFSEREAEDLLARAVELFHSARKRWWEATGEASGRACPMCLGAVGPYGAYLADGSEYRGHYGVDDDTLRAFHRRRMEILWEAGSDLLLIETQPSLHEALIEAELAEEMGADYWISFSCMDGKRIWEGDLLRDCAARLSVGHPHLKMLGINCTAPQYVNSLIDELKHGTELPIAVYPNSGETYDPVTKTWHGDQSGMRFSAMARRWMEQGADAVGGCCTTVGEHIRDVAAARELILGENPPRTISMR